VKKVGILQSSYLPWKGYFDLINSVDEFVIYDCMQYTKRDWRNKNYIKSPAGRQRLTIPVCTKGKFYQKISEVELYSEDWKEKHWGSFFLNYKKCPFLEEVADIIKPVYFEESHTHLSSVNRSLIVKICNYLNIKTKITSSADYHICSGKTERLVSICEQVGASLYISGPRAKDYVEADLFEEKNIKLEWMDYDNYPEYPQKWGDFVHNVSILDLLFNCGVDSLQYMKTSHK
jgi:hypothetical protein